MFQGWFQQPRRPIGVDFGGHTVRMVQLERQGDRLAVAAAAYERLPLDLNPAGDAYHSRVTETLRRLIDEGRFTGQTVVSCLPAAVLHCKNLRLPRMPSDELPEAVRWEARDRLHLGEPAMTQFLDAGIVRQGDEERQEVILLAAANTIIERHTRALLAVGLQPVAVDAIPTALARCFGRMDLEHIGVVIDVGYAQSKVLIHRGPNVLFYKQIDIGGAAFDQAVADTLSLDRHEAAELRQSLGQRDADVQRSVEEAVRPRMMDLSREIGLCLRYYSVTFRGPRPDRATLVGGESRDPVLARLISEGATLDAQQADPLHGMDLSRAGELGDPHEWATAVGLALRPMTERAAAGKRGAA